MIGILYLQQLSEILSEFSGTWINLKTSFDYLYEAAKDFSKETRCCHGSQTITTVASQSAYNLNSDFLEVMTSDDHGYPQVAYSDGTDTRWLSWESASDQIQSDASAGETSSFAIMDASIGTRISGTASVTHAHAGGESLLESATSLTSVAIGDTVINTTNSYYGIVIASGPTTAMFNLSTKAGAYAGWTNGDAFIIQPAPRYKLLLDPAPDTSGETVTVTYYAKPQPVYSDYGIYPFATGYEEAIIKYAAWLYKNRDSKQSEGDPLYMAYERAMRKAKNVNRKAVGSIGFRVNFHKD
jgi:hypothetical protein